MKQLKLVTVAALVSVVVLLAGCPAQEMAHPVLVQNGVFGFEPKWWSKSVAHVQVLTKDESVVGGPDTVALIGSCSDATVEQMQSLAPFATVWAVRATEPVSARDFRLVPGHVPDGFEQVIPPDAQPFEPVPGRTYFITVCLEPADERFYSLGVRWTPGQAGDVALTGARLHVEGPFRHAPSGMIFPVEVARFRRGEIRSYDADGRDVGVGYDLSSMTEPITATVYVFPMPAGEPTEDPPSFQELFEATVNEITTLHATARLVTQQEVSVPAAGGACPGRMAVFEYHGTFGKTRGDFRTYLYLFEPLKDTWLVKYRFTCPARVDASERIDESLHALDLGVISR
ncbi:MAG: hypothetical protein JW993_09635 [Sedimentisphaerales bacterium]|nr:hypothetical protein [Sedimentisphaerales bacterium]